VDVWATLWRSNRPWPRGRGQNGCALVVFCDILPSVRIANFCWLWRGFGAGNGHITTATTKEADGTRGIGFVNEKICLVVGSNGAFVGFAPLYQTVKNQRSKRNNQRLYRARWNFLMASHRRQNSNRPRGLAIRGSLLGIITLFIYDLY